MSQSPVQTVNESSFEGGQQPELVYASQWTYENGQNTRPMHRHAMCELLFVAEGEGLHTVAGQRYETRAGDLLIYNAGVVHEDSSPANGCERVYACGVERLRLPGLPPNFLLPRDARVLQHTGERRADFETLFRLIYQNTTQLQPHAGELAQQLLGALLLLVMQLGHETADSEHPESSQVNLMRGYIDTHFSEEISLDQIAAQAAISPYYASHLFKEYCGYSPMQYAIRRRIGEAQSLLLLTRLTVAQIAAQTGFDSANHFSTMFRKHTGCSPSQYRRTFLHDLELAKNDEK